MLCSCGCARRGCDRSIAPARRTAVCLRLPAAAERHHQSLAACESRPVLWVQASPFTMRERESSFRLAAAAPRGGVQLVGGHAPGAPTAFRHGNRRLASCVISTDGFGQIHKLHRGTLMGHSTRRQRRRRRQRAAGPAGLKFNSPASPSGSPLDRELLQGRCRESHHARESVQSPSRHFERAGAPADPSHDGGAPGHADEGAQLLDLVRGGTAGWRPAGGRAPPPPATDASGCRAGVSAGHTGACAQCPRCCSLCVMSAPVARLPCCHYFCT